MSAAIPATTEAMKRVAIAETFFIISKAVITGTKKSQGEILKVSLRPLENSDALIALLAGKNPNILVGYSQEHKALAKKYLTYINTTQ